MIQQCDRVKPSCDTHVQGQCVVPISERSGATKCWYFHWKLFGQLLVRGSSVSVVLERCVFVWRVNKTSKFAAGSWKLIWNNVNDETFACSCCIVQRLKCEAMFQREIIWPVFGFHVIFLFSFFPPQVICCKCISPTNNIHWLPDHKEQIVLYCVCNQGDCTQIGDNWHRLICVPHKFAVFGFVLRQLASWGEEETCASPTGTRIALFHGDMDAM